MPSICSLQGRHFIPPIGVGVRYYNFVFFKYSFFLYRLFSKNIYVIMHVKGEDKKYTFIKLVQIIIKLSMRELYSELLGPQNTVKIK